MKNSSYSAFNNNFGLRMMQKLSRASGILLHPTSLPSPFGIGDFGPFAFKFIDILKENGQKWWQMLPLGPTGYGNSPYQSFSAFAGNELLISPELLLRDGYLNKSNIDKEIKFADSKVDFENVRKFKHKLLLTAFENFQKKKKNQISSEFEEFKKRNSKWLNDYSLFISLKKKFDDISWIDWPNDFKDREHNSILKWKSKEFSGLEEQKFIQFIFFKQLNDLKIYANRNNVHLIGDIPIYVAFDSADVWSHREMFVLNANGSPKYVSGVPPDFFSDTGQLWGNPIYNWKYIKKDKYSWWVERLKHTFTFFDMTRLDHFRGFESYWSIPAKELTAISGKWIKGPSFDLFDFLINKLGEIPIIAEDLGIITEDVRELRNKYKFPGMKIFQFGFTETFNLKNEYLPHNYEENTVAYTGTHDNNTLTGWIKTLSNPVKDTLLNYLKCKENDLKIKILEKCSASKAILVIFPLQDILGLDEAAIMNRPSVAGGNWEWRCLTSQLQNDLFSILKTITVENKRV